MWRVKRTSLLLAILAYCYIPIFIFLFGWIKYYIAIPAFLLLLCFLSKFYKDSHRDKSYEVNIHWSVVCILSVFLLGICLVCGYGGFVQQAYDWYKHNAILQDLYTHSWPVLYNVEGEPALLTYYHALYLFPALLGKIFQSHQVTEISFGIIGFIGLWLMAISLIFITKADKWYKQIAVIVGFVAFSGLLSPLQKICQVLMENPSCGNSYRAFLIGGHRLEYRSVFVMIRWVGPQCFIAWLCLALFWDYKDNMKWYSIIALPALISGTWAFLGLVIIMLYYIIVNLLRKQIDWKDILSVPNIIIAILPGIPFLLYLFANKVIQGEGISNNEFGLTVYHGVEWWYLLLFYLFIYGLYTLVLWYENRKDLLFYAIPLSLISIPLFSIGSEMDFIMGVSIPAIILLYIYVARYLINVNDVRRGKTLTVTFSKCLLISFLLLGAKYPYMEAKHIIDCNSWHMKNDYAEQSMEICFSPDAKDKKNRIDWENYVSVHLTDNFYYKYISR